MLEIFSVWIGFMVAMFSRLLNLISSNLKKSAHMFVSVSRLWLSYLLRYKDHKNQTVGPVWNRQAFLPYFFCISTIFRKTKTSHTLLARTKLWIFSTSEINTKILSTGVMIGWLIWCWTRLWLGLLGIQFFIYSVWNI